MEENIERLKSILQDCTLCPRRCRVDRTRGAKGFCDLDDRLRVERTLPHHGEEPPLSGHRGAGTIFFSSCNLKCSYCQNHQISHRANGSFLGVDGLVRAMLDLQARGCHNVEAVTPTPQLPGLAEAIFCARGSGLTVPVVFNCGGYEDPGILRLAEGLVNVYLPDFKYGDDRLAEELSGVGDYTRFASASLEEMIRQAGCGLQRENGLAVQGVVVRHLILPGHIENSFAALKRLRFILPQTVPISLMSQYSPVPSVKDHPLLSRRISKEEYERVVHFALDLGFEELFVQDVDEKALSPDFSRENPFDWQGAESLNPMISAGNVPRHDEPKSGNPPLSFLLPQAPPYGRAEKE